jgi:methylated-DNA-[protein]-cysteine S-methyltransferase
MTTMTTTTYYSYLPSPLGQLLVHGDGRFVTGLFMPRHKRVQTPEASWRHDDAPFAAVREQLGEYFAGERRQFDVPVWLQGTPFQQRVWEELRRISFGATITYAQLAQRIGRPTASRAVGNANGRNPVAIVVPCHRVIGADGNLTGYASGLDNKQWLLAWERHAASTGRASCSTPDC